MARVVAVGILRQARSPALLAGLAAVGLLLGPAEARAEVPGVLLVTEFGSGSVVNAATGGDLTDYSVT